MGKFKSSERSALPTAILDVVVGAVEDDFENVLNEATGRWERGARKGRSLGVQTGAIDPDGVPELWKVTVPKTFDAVPFGIGQHALIVVEFGEWSGERGGGMWMRFAGFVSPDQFDSWKGVVATQQKVGQPA